MICYVVIFRRKVNSFLCSEWLSLNTPSNAMFSKLPCPQNTKPYSYFNAIAKKQYHQNH